jgi:ubiquinone/menaquinone biosynthesis C-methylase UbiE
MRVLDLGSGTGRWAQAFTAWYRGIEVIAVEPADAMRARSVYRPVVPGDAEHVPVDDGTLDAVWISTVIHHLPDLSLAAHELRRVLPAPGRPPHPRLPTPRWVNPPRTDAHRTCADSQTDAHMCRRAFRPAGTADHPPYAARAVGVPRGVARGAVCCQTTG